jgi:polysaccharide biosynthesis protein VpsQ
MLIEMRLIAALFSAFVVFVVVQADRGQFPSFLSWYLNIPYGDTFGHFFLIGLLAFLVNLSLKNQTLRIRRILFLKGSVMVGNVVVLEELSQIFISSRNFSFSDLGADFAGIYFFGRLARRFGSVNSKPVSLSEEES